MLSEKEIRELIDYMTQPSNKLHDKQFTWELNLLQMVLDGDSEAVAKPLLAEVLAVIGEEFDFIENAIEAMARGGLSEANGLFLSQLVRYRKEDLTKKLSEHFR